MEKQELNQSSIVGKKKKKKNKKSKSSAVQQIAGETSTKTMSEQESLCSGSDVLQRLGNKSHFSDLEVTITEVGQKTNPSSQPDKKGNKGLASVPSSSSVPDKKNNKVLTSASNQSVTKNSQKQAKSNSHSKSVLLNYGELGLNLMNHPDISVTLCKNEIEKNASITGNQAKEEQSSVTNANESIVPKKKKKKKKKSQKKNPEPPEPPSGNPEEPVSTPPTYVKVPVSDDTCVLLVSHQSFSSSSTNNKQDTGSIGSLTDVVGKICSNNTETNHRVAQTTLSSLPKAQKMSIPQALIASDNSVNAVPTNLPGNFLNNSSISLGLQKSNANSFLNMQAITAASASSSIDSFVTRQCDISVINDSNVGQTYPCNTTIESLNNSEKSAEDSKTHSCVDNSAQRVTIKRHDGQKGEENEVLKPTKAQLRAERRALQEAQRAAKLLKNNEIHPSKTSAPDKSAKENKVTANNTCILIDKVKTLNSTGNIQIPVSVGDSKTVAIREDASKIMQDTERSRKVRLFSHLPQLKSYSLLIKELQNSEACIHPAVVRVGAQYSHGIICGSNARCIALLAAFKEVIKDYVTPPNKELSRDLGEKLEISIRFLAQCRPLSVSMANAVKFLKYQITNIPSVINDDKAKEDLFKHIETFIKEEIILAKKAICEFAAGKIVDGDIILTYADSSLVKEVLCEAFQQKKNFRVIVADSRPKMEGREMLRSLLKKGIPCSYLYINAVSYVMKEVTKVIIGAHALQANGYVMSRVGCSQIALVASSYNVPVLVCCETYKFCERVHTDSFVYNELGDPHQLVNATQSQKYILENWKDIKSLQLLNLLYDITPPDLVAMVITEKGMLPCTSVPVVLRVRHAGCHEP